MRYHPKDDDTILVLISSDPNDVLKAKDIKMTWLNCFYDKFLNSQIKLIILRFKGKNYEPMKPTDLPRTNNPFKAPFWTYSSASILKNKCFSFSCYPNLCIDLLLFLNELLQKNCL